MCVLFAQVRLWTVIIYMFCNKLLHLARRYPKSKRKLAVQSMFQKHLILTVQTCHTSPALRPLIRRLKDSHPVFRTEIRDARLVFLLAEFLILHMQHFDLRDTSDQFQRLFLLTGRRIFVSSSAGTYALSPASSTD